MSLEARIEGDVTILSPHGMMFGGEETEELEAKLKELSEQGNMKLLINLERTSFVSSIPIGVLFMAHGRYRKHGARVKLCAVDAKIREIFDIVGLTLVYGENIHATEEEALAAFRRFPSLSPAHIPESVDP